MGNKFLGNRDRPDESAPPFVFNVPSLASQPPPFPPGARHGHLRGNITSQGGGGGCSPAPSLPTRGSRSAGPHCRQTGRHLHRQTVTAARLRPRSHLSSLRLGSTPGLSGKPCEQRRLLLRGQTIRARDILIKMQRHTNIYNYTYIDRRIMTCNGWTPLTKEYT